MKMFKFAGLFSMVFVLAVISIVFPLHYLSPEGLSVENVRNIDSISFETRGILRIVQGNSEYLHVEASDETLRRITVKVRGKTVHIGYRGIFTGARELPVFTLGIKEIKSLRVLSAGEVEAESIDAKTMLIDCDSSGDVNIGSLAAEDVSVRIGSSGNVLIDRCSTASLSAVLSSSGDFGVAGETARLALDLSSSGNVAAGRLSATYAEIRIRSSGSVDARITERLIPHLSGKGTLRCFGRPVVEGNGIGEDGTLTFMDE